MTAIEAASKIIVTAAVLMAVVGVSPWGSVEDKGTYIAGVLTGAAVAFLYVLWAL